MAVSYSPNARYRARIRRTTSFGSMTSPSLERLEARLRRVGRGQDVAEQVPGLVDRRTGRRRWRAKTSMVTTGSSPSRARMRLGAGEVDVGRVPRQDLVRRSSTLQAHQSRIGSSLARFAAIGRRLRLRGGGECSVRLARCAPPGRPRGTQPQGLTDVLIRCACIRWIRRRRRPRHQTTIRSRPIRAATASTSRLTTRPRPSPSAPDHVAAASPADDAAADRSPRRERRARRRQVGLGRLVPQPERQERGRHRPGGLATASA